MELLGTGIQRAAKTSKVLVSTQPLTFASYEASLTGDDLQTVNFQSYDNARQETFDEGIMGVLYCAVRFGGDWDAGTNPLDDPPGLFPRDDLPHVQFFTDFLDAVDWDFPLIRVRTATNGGTVKDKVTFDVDGKNQGPFDHPAGSV